MIITLDNDSDLGGTQDFLNIQGSRRTIPFTIRQIAIYYAEKGAEELEIQIHKSLFPSWSSYKANPAQLAKNANIASSIYPITHGTTKGDYVVIMFTHKPKPLSFWRQCLDYCQIEGTYEFSQDEVPQTYRYTPSLLRWRLKEATGKKVRVIRTPKRFKLIVPRTRLS